MTRIAATREAAAAATMAASRPAASVQISDPSRSSRQRGEYEQVHTDRPLHLDGRAVELALDRVQRDHHRRLVEEDQHVGHAGGDEHPALLL
jgi:hypothetical protein